MLEAQEWVPVAPQESLASGDLLAIRVGERDLVLGRDGDTLFALQARCPHQGTPLVDGIIARGHVVCPSHGWRFSVQTGQLDLVPETCLQRFAVRVKDGAIEVNGSRPLPPAPSLATDTPHDTTRQ